MWRVSQAEIRDSFLTHLQSAAEIEAIAQKRRDKCAQSSVTPQPFVVVVGASLETISSIFVVVDRIHYKHDSVLAALDTCFKLFFVLQARYPEESAPVWTLIQRGFYQLQTKWDKVYTSVNCVMSDLGMK